MSALLAPSFLGLPAVQTVFEIMRKAGGEARLVGGCVRDYMLGRQVDEADIDMAVNLPIEKVVSAARQADIRVLETGLAHGSVTLVIEGRSIEITQTRADIAPDGRHTEIGFTADWYEDAQRRDFTMNALYLDEAGQLYDEVGGLADLQKMNLRFIGDAAARIDEDYLRILRAVRFVGQMPDLCLSQEALIPMAQKAEKLRQLSGERIQAELKKSFASKGWQKSAALMRETTIDQALFGTAFILENSDDFDQKIAENWLVRLASLLSREALIAQSEALRFSTNEKQTIMLITKPFSGDEWAVLTSDKWAEYAYHEPLYLAERALVFMRHHHPPLKMEDERLRQIALFIPPPCPVTGHDLLQASVPSGKSLGILLKTAKSHFAASQFKASKDEILSHLLDQRMTGNDRE